MPSSSTTTLLALYISQLWQIVTPKTYHAFLDADGTVHSLSPPGSDSECNEAVVASQYECYGSENATLLVRAPDGQSELKTFEVPPLPSQPEAYSYATEEAFLVLPARCALELGLTPNVGDSDNLIEHWMGRMSELPGSTEALYDNVRYAIMMAASGYAVIVPDSFASSTLGLRYKAPVANLSAHLRQLNSQKPTMSYWCDNNVYLQNSTCPASMMKESANSTLPSYPLCYSSNADAIASHLTDWLQYYERVHRLRRLELNYLVEHIPLYIEKSPKVFLAGESEGAVSAARYHHPNLDLLLQTGGRIILQYSCEWSYFLSCSSHADIGGCQTNTSTPVLNLISRSDPFFSAANGSVAYDVRHSSRGLLGFGDRCLTGNCFAKFRKKGFKYFLVATLNAQKDHGLTLKMANFVRFVINAFLAAPREIAQSASSLASSCSSSHRNGSQLFLEACDELGLEQGNETMQLPPADQTECAKNQTQPLLRYLFLGERELCARVA